MCDPNSEEEANLVPPRDPRWQMPKAVPEWASPNCPAAQGFVGGELWPADDEPEEHPETTWEWGGRFLPIRPDPEEEEN